MIRVITTKYPFREKITGLGVITGQIEQCQYFFGTHTRQIKIGIGDTLKRACDQNVFATAPSKNIIALPTNQLVVFFSARKTIIVQTAK